MGAHICADANNDIRKTGITLKQNERDEHGIEVLDGIFSSPAKSPPRRVTRNAANAAKSSSSMEIAQSTFLLLRAVIEEHWN
jgi:Kinetochore CENP-C fungal homologue, Mif2, N-terminal